MEEVNKITEFEKMYATAKWMIHFFHPVSQFLSFSK